MEKVTCFLSDVLAFAIKHFIKLLETKVASELANDDNCCR